MVWALLGAGTVALAADVRLDVSTRETYVGVPVQVSITIANAQSHEPPVLPEIPGTTLRSNGAPSRSVSLMSVNGVMTQSTTLVYSWSVTPRQPGRITIPPVIVEADGLSQQTEAVQIIVSQSETGDLLIVELKGSRPRVYVGEQLRITLQIYIKPFINPRLTLRPIDMVNQINLRASQWGAFEEPLANLMNRRANPDLSEVRRKDRSGKEHVYYLFELEREFYPDRPGQLDVGEVSILMAYPVRITQADLFGRASFDTRPISAALSPSSVIVQPIPTQGRPPIWNGAVGQYTINTTAKPTDVSVGDPITLNIVIEGAGRLETLQPPPLAQLPELTRDFKVPSDPLGGMVEGGAKKFSQSIRANTASVTQIPPIPFAYFDPKAEKFIIVRSQPIPIKVKAGQSLSMSQIIESPGAGRTSASPQLTEVQGGILANYSDMDEVLGQQAYQPGWGTAVILTAPPLLCAAAFVTRRRAERLRSDSGLARRRVARKRAVARIRSAGAADPRLTAAAVAEALARYVADRLNLPPGGLTRAEIVQHLTERNVKTDVVRRFDELLEQCEALSYAGQDGQSTQRLSTSAIEAIEAMEREKV